MEQYKSNLIVKLPLTTIPEVSDAGGYTYTKQEFIKMIADPYYKELKKTGMLLVYYNNRNYKSDKAFIHNYCNILHSIGRVLNIDYDRNIATVSMYPIFVNHLDEMFTKKCKPKNIKEAIESSFSLGINYACRQIDRSKYVYDMSYISYQLNASLDIRR